jgi:hypothetical protein
VPNLYSSVNRIGGVLDSMLFSSVVYRVFETQSPHIKSYKSGMYCFSAKYAALKSKSEDGLAWNRDNVSDWSDMSTTIKKNPTKRVGLVQRGHHRHVACSRHDLAENCSFGIKQ